MTETTTGTPAPGANPHTNPPPHPDRPPSTTPALSHARAFTTWIERRSAEHPEARAALRRGAGKDLDAVPSMHQYVAPWLTEDHLQDRGIQRAHYTVAALIAAQHSGQYPATAQHTSEQPEREEGRSLGRSFADWVARGSTGGGGPHEAGTERRLSMLTRQSAEGLHRHLPAAVRQLRHSGITVDWAQLLVDLSLWRRHSGEVGRHWLQDYYQARQASAVHRAREADRHFDDTAKTT
ncbi:type I-E CRISPR-associated protein Cse2/CasB (plasmid) [Kitasatospora sp. NBC_00070]|uniref:type I-E CRISPR-associated protein Cse2/CasB n=1 Tax=Kitasatospora sp. NBC_00070 TaxID=2975962 RepID=UPI002F915EEA